MNVKKLLVIAMAFVLLLTGCASSNEWDNSTVTAQVTAISGRKVTLAFGEIAMGQGREMPEGFEKGERPEMPENFQMPEGFEMPEGMEMPEGGFERPEGFEGEMPDFAKGEKPQMPEGFEGKMPEGDFERPQMGGGMGFDMSQLFTANGKTVTVELSQSVVDGLAEEDIVQVKIGRAHV